MADAGHVGGGPSTLDHEVESGRGDESWINRTIRLELMHPFGTRELEPSGRRRPALELFLRGGRLREELECELLAERPVVRRPHLPHGPSTEEADELVFPPDDVTDVDVHLGFCAPW